MEAQISYKPDNDTAKRLKDILFENGIEYKEQYEIITKKINSETYESKEITGELKYNNDVFPFILRKYFQKKKRYDFIIDISGTDVSEGAKDYSIIGKLNDIFKIDNEEKLKITEQCKKQKKTDNRMKYGCLFSQLSVAVAMIFFGFVLFLGFYQIVKYIIE